MKKLIFAILTTTLSFTILFGSTSTLVVHAEPAEVLEEEEPQDEATAIEYADPDAFLEAVYAGLTAYDDSLDYFDEYEAVKDFENAVFEDEGLTSAAGLYFNSLKSMLEMDYIRDHEDLSYYYAVPLVSLHYIALADLSQNYGLELTESTEEGINDTLDMYAFLISMMGLEEDPAAASEEPAVEKPAVEAAV